MIKFLKQKTIYLVEFIVFLSIFAYGLFMFMAGYHNADICHNEQNIENVINNQLVENDISFKITISEFTLNFNKLSLTECYLNGINLIIKGFFIAIFGAFFGGLVLGRI